MSRRQSKKYLNESFDDLLEMHLFEDEEAEVSDDEEAEGLDDLLDDEAEKAKKPGWGYRRGNTRP